MNKAYETDGQEDESVSVDSRGKICFKKTFLNRKKSSASTRRQRRRNRLNRQLRTTLTPKNALMALKEVKGITMGEFEVNVNSGGGFTAVITANGKEFQGKGVSKEAAKNNACEKVFRENVITKMLEKPKIPTVDNDGTAGEQSVETMDFDDENSDSAKDDADEMSVMNLASFAIFKLFTEWERDGFSVPVLHPPPVPGAPSTEPNGGAELPSNWETMHPTSLLYMMRPDLTYKEYGVVEGKTRPLQLVGVIIDGTEFFGTGNSKKLARKNTAIAVCNTLFGTNFPKEKEE